MNLNRLGRSQSPSASLESEGAGESIDTARSTSHGSVPCDGGCRFGALREAADDGIEVVCGRGSDLAEDGGGEGEGGAGGDGAEVEEFGAGGAELEFRRGDEVGLDLLNVGEGGAFLHE